MKKKHIICPYFVLHVHFFLSFLLFYGDFENFVFCCAWPIHHKCTVQNMVKTTEKYFLIFFGGGGGYECIKVYPLLGNITS